MPSPLSQSCVQPQTHFFSRVMLRLQSHWLVSYLKLNSLVRIECHLCVFFKKNKTKIEHGDYWHEPGQRCQCKELYSCLGSCIAFENTKLNIYVLSLIHFQYRSRRRFLFVNLEMYMKSIFLVLKYWCTEQNCFVVAIKLQEVAGFLYIIHVQHIIYKFIICKIQKAIFLLRVQKPV